MAVLKLSQITNSGANFTSGDFIVAVQSGTTDILFSFAQLFGGANLAYSSNVLFQRNSTTAQTFLVYNTTDSNTSPTNYERGTFDWVTNTNILTIGTQKGGSGTLREILFTSNSTFRFGTTGAGLGLVSVNDVANGLVVVIGGIVGISSGNLRDSPTPQAGITSPAAGVLACSTAYNSGSNGWLQWVGEKRVTSDFTKSADTTLATVTGLSVPLVSGRTYSFTVYLMCSITAAGGVKCSIDTSDTLTATNIVYQGYIVDTAAILANTQATALATTVDSATTTGTTPLIMIQGTITVNAAGTLVVNFAQNTGTGAATVKRGSYMIINDMP